MEELAHRASPGSAAWRIFPGSAHTKEPRSVRCQTVPDDRHSPDRKAFRMNRKQSSEPGSPAFPPAACRALTLHACAWFTVLSTLMLLIYAILDRAPSPLRLLLFLPLSLCFACAARIRHSSLSRAARTVSHALLTLGSAYAFVYLPVQIEQKPTAGTTLLFLFLSVLVYAIGAAIIAAVAHRRDSRTVNEQPYRSQFGKRDQ